MKTFRYAPALTLLLVASLTGRPAQAFFHFWRFAEVFSANEGDVQFIELVSGGSAETVAQGATITSTSTGKVFTFPSNLTGNTTNKRLLIATDGFGALSGAVAPDFTLPSTDFFNPNGDTLTLFQFGTIDTRTFTAIPSDGVMSRIFPVNTNATNSPTNYTGAMGSVNVQPPGLAGDFNGDDVVDGLDLTEWRNAFSSSGDADADDDGDSDGADFLAWQTQLGMTSASPTGKAIPEPAAATLAVGGLLIAQARRPRQRATTA
jgi:hypothetical protein